MVTEPEQPKETPVVEGGETLEPITAEQSEHPAETPVVADAGAVTVKNEENDVDDTAPLTVDEFINAGRQVAQTAKNAALMPLYRLGRRYIRSAQAASESFFDFVNDNKDKK